MYLIIFAFAVINIVLLGGFFLFYRRPTALNQHAARELQNYFNNNHSVEVSLGKLAKPPKSPENHRLRVRSLAYGLANEAYAKFGNRPRNAQNLIVTRKFIFDLLDGKKDLRIKDKINAIDIALEYSFLPSEGFVSAHLERHSDPMIDHMSVVKPQSAWWAYGPIADAWNPRGGTRRALP